MGGIRTRRFGAAIAIAVIASGLVGLASTPATAATTVQDGPVNYAGPGPCPAGTTDCLIAAGDVDVSQTGDSNTVDCRGADCKAVQSGPQNTATCANSTTAASSEQRCDVSQTGGANKITADVSASPATGAVNLASVLQQNAQRLLTSQTGATNELTVNATINQQATSILDAATPVTHTQRTLLSSSNTMTATTSNKANLTLNRTQNSSTTGASPTQTQDSDGGAGFGLGDVRLIAKTPGTNAIKIRANDTKTQNSTSLNNGLVTQTQGREGGGWNVDLSGTDTGTANAGGAADVDLGTPGSADGIIKAWTQNANGFLGGNPPRNQDQIDGIKIPIIGNSPINVLINGRGTLQSNQGANSVCRAQSEGHAQALAQGQLSCSVTAGNESSTDSKSWASQTWGHDVNCTPSSCDGDGEQIDIYGIKIKINGGYSKNGVIPVAVLSQPDNNPATVDDASEIDPSTACFGTADGVCDSTLASPASFSDEDGDGASDDLKLHFEANQTGLKPTSTEGCLRAETYDGRNVFGCTPFAK